MSHALKAQEQQAADSLDSWHGIEAEHTQSTARLRAALKQSSGELQAAQAELRNKDDSAQSLSQQLQDCQQQVSASSMSSCNGVVVSCSGSSCLEGLRGQVHAAERCVWPQRVACEFGHCRSMAVCCIARCAPDPKQPGISLSLSISMHSSSWAGAASARPNCVSMKHCMDNMPCERAAHHHQATLQKAT